jgi:hypothetical protein
MTRTTRAVLLIFGVALTAAEAWGVADFLWSKGAPTYALVIGVLVAVGAPFLSWVPNMRVAVAITLPLAVVAIFVSSVSRISTAADLERQQRAKTVRQSTLAVDTKAELEQTLADAREAVRTACVKRTKACVSAEQARDKAQADVIAARGVLAKVPVAAGDPVSTFLSDLTGGYVSPERVAFYVPLLTPLVGTLMAAIFLGAGAPRPRETAPTAAAAAAEPVSTVAPAPPTNVVKVLADVVVPANRKARVEIADVLGAYVAACKTRSVAVADSETFVAQAKAFAEAAGIRVLSSGGKLFWCGVKLVA